MTGDREVAEPDVHQCEVTTRYGQLLVPDPETDLIGRFLSRYGEWAWLEAVFVASVIPDGARVLDAGAFAGTFGLGVALSRRLDFLCFVEANAAIIPLLKRNVTDRTHCPSVVCEALIAESRHDQRIAHLTPGNLGALSFAAADAPDAIRSVTLADLRTEYGAFDLIKLDIEGMELDALLGDADFLARGKTTLWIEANEDIRSLDVGRLLLSWNIDLFYVAFPAFNPRNFNGDPEPVFPFAFEAGLLVAPRATPSLSPELREAGCILKQLHSVDDLKDALWCTPRWGMAEWQGAATTQEFIALAGRSLRGESFTSFLTSEAVTAADAETTIWQRLTVAQTVLRDVRTRLDQAEAESRDAQALAAQRLDQLETERSRTERLRETQQMADALAAQRLEQLQSVTNTLRLIQGSTVWRASAPLRRFVAGRPTLHAALRALRAKWGPVVKRRFAHHKFGTAPVRKSPGRIAAAADGDHRTLVGPYFDPAFYLAANNRLLAAGVDPLDHFLREGWREGCDPGPGFDVAYYLAANQDVADAGINPVLHYVWAGKAEGRLPRRPLRAQRDCLAKALAPRDRALDWMGGLDRSPPLSQAALVAALSAARGRARLVVSISHDDYAVNCGGIQNVVADEQRAFDSAGWRYLHVSPAAPLPMLADHGPAADYHLRLRLNGRAIGVARFPDLAAVLTASRPRGTRLAFIFHHLLGHVPELLATLPVPAEDDVVLWVHDFFTICPSFNLMRNDVAYCGAPPSRSAACTVCVFGTERLNHQRRIRAFFTDVEPTVIAPSETALDFWRARGRLPYANSAVSPPARLHMATTGEPIATPADAPLRVAHLGGISMHKGWPVFERLATAHANDPRYEFHHLGIGDKVSSNYINEPVRVSPDQRNAMIDAIVRNRIDVVICWSLWPETFCFTVHEALAGGAFIVARRDAGNVWAAVQTHAPRQGCVVPDELSLFQMFESGEIRTWVSRASRFTGTLHPDRGTAGFLLADRTMAAFSVAS